MTKYTFDENIYSDLYKEVYGSRPRGDIFYTSDDAGKQAIWDNLIQEHEEKMAEDKIAEDANIKNFEDWCARLIELGATDRRTAIRWIVQSYAPNEMDLAYGASWVQFKLGVPFSYLKNELDQVMKEMGKN